jgi:hypothetical protein
MKVKNRPYDSRADLFVHDQPDLETRPKPGEVLRKEGKLARFFSGIVRHERMATLLYLSLDIASWVLIYGLISDLSRERFSASHGR